VTHATPTSSLATYLDAFDALPGYLDFGRSGPPARTTAAAAGAYWERMSRGDVDEHREDAAARAAAARLIGFEADAVALSPNTSLGLFHAAFALNGDVLVSRGEFSANLYPWWRAEELGLLRVRHLASDAITDPVTPERVSDALTPATTAVAVSAVDFRTGWRADLAGIRDVIGDRLLVVDGIQGMGVADVPWHHADVIVAGGQKWLRAGWGSGFVALSARAQDRMTPRLNGWTAAENPMTHDGVPHATAPGAQHMRVTNGSPASAHVLTHALDLVNRVGVATLERLIAERTTLLDGLLREHGIEVASPASATDRAGIVVARFADDTAPERWQRLVDAGIRTTLHAPDRIRFSLHATTTHDDIARAAEVVSRRG